MKKDLIDFLWILFVMFIFCGKDVFISFCQSFLQIIKIFLPYLLEEIINSFLLSPYRIVKIIMVIASVFFGYWFGRKKGKVLYQIVSFVIVIYNLISLCVEFS